jgi:hypothetical protein
LNALVWRSPSDLPAFFLALGLFIVTAIYLGYLLRVRRNDDFLNDEGPAVL